MTDATARDEPQSQPRTLREEVLRDIGGALLFGVPLVYTMEVWWLGETSSTATLGIMTLLAGVLSGIIRYAVVGRLGWTGSMLAGFRCVALSIILSGAFSFVIGVLVMEDSWSKIVGVTAAIAVPLSLGAALGSVLFSDPEGRTSGGGDEDERSQATGVARNVVGSVLGATFIALPIAPTGEIPTINAMTDTWRLLITVPVCVLICYTIVYASGFHERRGGSATQLSAAAVETLISAAIGIIMAAALLFAFGAVDTASPAAQIVGYIGALAIPASIGAAAGRIAAA